MFEFRQPLILIEFVPVSRINLAANAIDIKDLLCQQQTFGVQADIINVIVPAGVFPISTQINGWFPLAGEHSLLLTKEFLQELAHVTAQCQAFRAWATSRWVLSPGPSAHREQRHPTRRPS